MTGTDNLAETLFHLRRHATNIRAHALRMGAVQGQGYVGQALGVADILAVAYCNALAYDPDNPHWEGRDRFLLSAGHYAIALYAALIEAGILPLEEIESYGADGSRLPMSGMAHYTPGMEITGGSLGQGLPIAVGMALALKRKASRCFVYNLMSDGELDEGATWEAAMSGPHFRLDNLVALIDCNGIQADGPVVLDMEPVAEKWRAFGWETLEIDGNDMAAMVGALTLSRSRNGKPKAIVLRTSPGRGVPRIENSEKSHFFRVDPAEWDSIIAAFEKSVGEPA